MPSYRSMKQPKPIECDKFLGLNESFGDTEVKLGEAIYMRNFNITNNYKLRKRTGYTIFKDFAVEKPIRGMWRGFIDGDEVLIAAVDGNVVKYDFLLETYTTIGTMTDANTTMFYFGSKLYFLNGVEYKEYDGTTFQNVVPYIPTVAIGSPPTGGGTLFEQINVLTGKKKQEFVSDGVTATYTLAESAIESVDNVWVGGVLKTLTTHYTVNITAGTIMFTSGNIPVNEAQVIIEWTKTVSTHADLVKKNKYTMTFGAGNDTNIFMWGNPDYKNRMIFSYVISPGYFPVNNFTDIGSDEFAITDIVGQYSRQIIFKEDRTYYSYAEYNAGLGGYIYPVYDLNESIGNETFNGAQVIDNDPVTLKQGFVWRWTNTSVEDERNVKTISDRVRKSLSVLNLKNAITFDNQKEKEYWLAVDGLVYIFNYGNDTWYVYDNINANCFIDVDGVVYFGTPDGKINRFDGVLNDNGVAIESYWKSGFTDFGAYEYQKNSRDMWFSINPASRTSLSIKCPTNRKNEDDPTIKTFKEEFVFFDLSTIDFDDFSFQTNRNPQTLHIKLKAKKYSVLQFIFFNVEIDEELIVISFKVNVETGNIIR